MRLLEHLDGVGVKLADALYAQVRACARGDAMQRSVLKEAVGARCGCSCRTEEWPQKCVQLVTVRVRVRVRVRVPNPNPNLPEHGAQAERHVHGRLVCR